MKRLALALIRAYQRWISPRKGFTCAYRLHGGGAGCSGVGARLIRRHGVWNGLPLLRERLRRCGEVHRQWHAARPLAAQRGDCDIGCIDLPGLDCEGPGRLNPLDACDCCSCDWPSRKDGEKKRERRRRHESDTRPSRQIHAR